MKNISGSNVAFKHKTVFTYKGNTAICNKIYRGVHPPSVPGGNLPPNSDALPYPLSPYFFIVSVLYLSVALPLLFHSGIARKMYRDLISFSSLFLPRFPLVFLLLFFSFPCFLLLLVLFLRSKTPEMQLGGLGERYELPQWGMGRSPSRNQIWCILALKDEIWWQ